MPRRDRVQVLRHPFYKCSFWLTARKLKVIVTLGFKCWIVRSWVELKPTTLGLNRNKNASTSVAATARA